MFGSQADYKSRFRILKGGKISLVVSTLLMGTSFVVTDAKAISAINTNPYHISSVDTYSLSLDSTVDLASDIINSGLGITINANTYVLNANINHNMTITDADFALRINNPYIGSSISNSSTISITSANDNVKGIANDYMSYSSLTNSGTITINAGDNIDSNAFGIHSSYMYNASLTNSGTITVNAGNGRHAYGIYSSDMVSTTSITNSGTINVNSVSGEYAIGISINASDSTASITNSGTITAMIDNVADKNAWSVYSKGSDTLSNTSTGVLNGNIYHAGTVNNAGTISLPYNASNIGTYTYISTFVNSGTLKIGLLTDGATTTHSQLQTDTATFNSGSTLNVNVLSASTNVDLLIGNTLNDVVTASTSLTLNGTLNITDNSALVNFEYVQDGNTIDLNVVEGTSILDSTIAGGGNAQAQAAGTALQAIEDGGVPSSMTSFFSALNGLSTDAQVAQAVASTTPTNTASTAGAATQIANGIQGIVEQRQGLNMGGGMNSGEDLFAEKTFWFKPYGSWGNQDSKNGVSGFDLDAYGAGLGFDGEYAKDARLGFALFYTDARVKVDSSAQRSDLDVYTALLYGMFPVIDNQTKIMYQAGYSWQKTDSSRYIALTSETAKSDYTAKMASLNVKLVRDYKISHDLTLQPLVEASYHNFKNPSYNETGASTALNVDSFDGEEFIVGIGGIAHYKIDDTSKLVANLNIGYDLMDDNIAVTSAFSASPTYKFTTSGIDNGRWSYGAGVGYEKQFTKETSATFMYNYEAQGSTYDTHSVSARIQYKF
ncbi:MAG: autotransporter domain-containing protein [Epsilonproteobacteria bacterium]|nr:autotransporter domain-containing protein [Campylobacterota bacterium]